MIKLPDSARNLEGLADILIDTPNGKIPLSKIASIEDGDGPNQISRDGGKRRIVLSANASKRALSDIVAVYTSGKPFRCAPVAYRFIHSL